MDSGPPPGIAVARQMRTAFTGAARQLRSERVSAFFILLTLAIGVGAAVAIFVVARGVLLRPLPYHDPESLVAIQEYQPATHADPGAVAYANVPRYRAIPGIVAATAFSYSELVLSGDGDAERVIGANVDGDLFATLGVRPALGRGIDPAETGETPAHVAVISYGLWRRRFGADRDIVSRSVTIDGDAYSIIGVAAEGFEFPRNPSMDRDVDIWVPRRPPPPMMLRRGSRDLTVIARLAPNVAIGDFRQRLEASLMNATKDDTPLNTGWRARAIGLRAAIVGRVEPAILLLGMCVALLLFVACMNASAALLARTTVRRSAHGVRLALGASNGQLVATVFAEATLLAVGASVLAIPLGAAATAVLMRVAPVAVPRQGGISIDATAIVFTIVAALSGALVATIAPWAWLRRLKVNVLLSESRTAAGSRQRTRALGAFVIAQVALGTAILVPTLTLSAKYVRLHRVNPGFETNGITIATIPMRGMRYRDAVARWNLTSQLVARAGALPGVEHAAVASLMPLSGGLMSAPFSVRGNGGDTSTTAMLRAVSPGFFQTLGIPLREGRAIEPGDNAQAPLVVVVNDAFVRTAFAGRRALGAVVSVSPPGADGPIEFQIVGVVGDAKERDLLSEDSPIIYFSDAQESFPHVVLALRAKGPPPIAAVRGALHDLDPSLALDDVGPISARVRATYALQYFQLSVLGAFALSALVLIAVGVYGAASFVAASDRRATGIRLALGATSGQMIVALLRRTGTWSLIGCAIGLTAAVMLQAILGTSSDMEAVGVGVASALVMLAVALLATLRPAWRAGSMDPLRAVNAQ